MGSIRVNSPVHFDRSDVDKVVKEHVLAMSETDIAQHLLVMKMMQRLAALEGRHIVAFDNDDASMHERTLVEEVGKEDNGRK